MSEEPEVSEETPEKPAEAVTDEELDDVAGGLAKAPLKDDASFVSFPPQFIKVMSYHDVGVTDSVATTRSVSDIFDTLAKDSAADD